MQYVILGVALYEVLIVIALGHVEANVKSLGKKKLKKKIFKIIIKTISNEKNLIIIKTISNEKNFKKMKIKNLISKQKISKENTT